MIGLMILLAAGIYLAVWVTVVIFSYNKTLKATQSKKQAFAISAFFFLVMYMIPFWDLIPTLVIHEYHCSRQAQFTVYKSPEEWIAENPGTFASLEPFQQHISLNSSMGNGTQMNDRFGTILKKSDISIFPVQKKQWKIIDVVTNEVIAEDVDFGRGFGEFGVGNKGALKFWLYKSTCFSERERADRSKKTMGKLFDKLNMTRRVQ